MTSGLRGWTAAWWEGGGGGIGHALDWFLWPAERAFATAVRLRNAAYDRGWLARREAAIPVVSIGNLSVGGVGKTPLAAWTAARLGSWGLRPAIVLRGYGADEVLVHRELNPDVPVYTARRRADGVAEAAAAGRDVAVLDDAFQHRSLARDLDVVVVSAESWAARRRLLPRGPWRESITAVRRAHLVVVTRKTAPADRVAAVQAELRRVAPATEVAVCALRPSGFRGLDPTGGRWLPLGWIAGRRVLAVASLGDPRSFAGQLENLRAEVELMAFPDHHEFTAAEADRIVARAAGRAILLTRKEAVKLRPLLSADADAVLLDQEVEFEAGSGAFLDLLRDATRR